MAMLIDRIKLAVGILLIIALLAFAYLATPKCADDEVLVAGFGRMVCAKGRR